MPFLFAPESALVSTASSKFDYLHTDIREKILEANDAVTLPLLGDAGDAEKEEKGKPDSISITDGKAAGTLIGSPLFYPSLGVNE